MQNNFPAGRLAGLDTLRFFAFLSVFIFHKIPAFIYGNYGVDFFFVLSSFLLTTLALSEFQNTGKFSKLNFFMRRALRIFPLYYLIIFFSFLVLPHLADFLKINISFPQNKILYWFLLSNYEQTDCVFYLKFLWSIAAEEQFYILFIILSFLLKRHILLYIGILLSTYLIFMIYALNNNVDTYSNTIAHFPNFSMGMLTAYHYHKYRQININKIIFIAFPISIAGMIFSQNEIPFNIFISIFFSILLLLMISFGNKLVKFNFFKITEHLGKYSYGLYVYSGLVITLFSKIIFTELFYINIVLQFITLLLLAYTSYHLYEKRFLKLKAYFR